MIISSKVVKGGFDDRRVNPLLTGSCLDKVEEGAYFGGISPHGFLRSGCYRYQGQVSQGKA